MIPPLARSHLTWINYSRGYCIGSALLGSQASDPGRDWVVSAGPHTRGILR